MEKSKEICYWCRFPTLSHSKCSKCHSVICDGCLLCKLITPYNVVLLRKYRLDLLHISDKIEFICDLCQNKQNDTDQKSLLLNLYNKIYTTEKDVVD